MTRIRIAAGGIGFNFLPVYVAQRQNFFANNGIGYLISSLGDGGDYAGMFACVIAISLVGFAADRLSIAAIRRLLMWRE